MNISKKSQYGLRAMLCLARSNDKFLPLREISNREGIPFNYLEKIFSNLEKEGLLKSKKGSQGGYGLSLSPKKITVGDIMRILEKRMILVECIGGSGICYKDKYCKSKKAWEKLQASIDKTVDSIILYNLI